MGETLPSSKALRFNGRPVVLLLHTNQLAGCRGIVSLGSTHRSMRVTSFKYTPLALGSCVLPVVANERLFFYVLIPFLLPGLDWTKANDTRTRSGGATR